MNRVNDGFDFNTMCPWRAARGIREPICGRELFMNGQPLWVFSSDYSGNPESRHILRNCDGRPRYINSSQDTKNLFSKTKDIKKKLSNSAQRHRSMVNRKLENP